MFLCVFLLNLGVCYVFLILVRSPNVGSCLDDYVLHCESFRMETGPPVRMCASEGLCVFLLRINQVISIS